MGVVIKCHQGRTNAIPICDEQIMSVLYTSYDVFLTQLFLILNESRYVFDNFQPISHEVGFARRWFSIRKQIFHIIVLTSHEYHFVQAPIRECAQMFELYGGNTIISHIEAELLCFHVSHQMVPSLQHIWLDEGLQI